MVLALPRSCFYHGDVIRAFGMYIAQNPSFPVILPDSAVEHGDEQLLKCAVEVFSNIVLLGQCLDRVLPPNAVLGKECFPLDADELAALVVVQAQNDLSNCFSTMALNCVNASNISDFFRRR
jgi:hypothetical protein